MNRQRFSVTTKTLFYLHLIMLTIMMTLSIRSSFAQIDQSIIENIEVSSDEDTIPWKFPTSSDEVVVVGEVNGDLDALKQILGERGLVDATGKWIGGKKSLVQMGGMIGRGGNSLLIMDWYMQLEGQAKAAGGAVHVLLGHHELETIRGDTKYISSSYSTELQHFSIPEGTKIPDPSGGSADKVRYAFSRHGPYGKWLAKKNAILQIGDKVFMNGGVDTWATQFDMGKVNSTLRDWVDHFQKIQWGEESRAPDPSTTWVTGLDSRGKFINLPGKYGYGPLYSFDTARGKTKAEWVDAALEKLGAQQLFTSNWSQKSGIAQLYDGKVWAISPMNDSDLESRPRYVRIDNQGQLEPRILTIAEPIVIETPREMEIRLLKAAKRPSLAVRTRRALVDCLTFPLRALNDL